MSSSSAGLTTVVVNEVKSVATPANALALAKAAWDAFMKEEKLPEDAQKAIEAMRVAVPELDQSFLNALKRDGFGSVKAFFSGQVFDGNKVARHLLKNQMESTSRLARSTEPNLKEAVGLLIIFQGEIAAYYNQRSTEFTTVKEYSYVLLILHYTLHVLIQKLSDQNTVGDDVVSGWHHQLNEIRKAFSTYVSVTKTQTNSANRRGTIVDFFDAMVKKVQACLESYKSSRTLQGSIHVLRNRAEVFATQLQRVLFAIIILPGKEAALQLKSDELGYSNKLLFLERLLVEGDKEAVLLCDEVKSAGYETMFQAQAQGTLYRNPFARRMKALSEEYKKAKSNPKILLKKKELFYGVLLAMLRAKDVADRDQKSAESDDISKFAERFNDEKRTPGNFKLLKREAGNMALLKADSNVGIFLQATLELFQQTVELVRFLNALTGFIEMVGKMGMYSEKELHALLKNLILTLQDQFKKNFYLMIGCINEKVHGMWLEPLHVWFDQIKMDGESIIKREMNDFFRDFMSISDTSKMKAEFDKVKKELIEAAVGMAAACHLKKSDIDTLKAFINARQLAAAPIPVSTGAGLVMMEQAVLREEHLRDHIKLVVGEFEAKIVSLQDKNEAGQKQLAEIKTLVKNGDDEVNDLIVTLTKELKARQESNQTCIRRAADLMKELNPGSKEGAADAKPANETALENARKLLTELKVAEVATGNLVVLVTQFAKRYAAHANQINDGLRDLQDIYHSMQHKIDELHTMAVMLQRMIEMLQQQLSEKDAKIAELAKQNETLKARLEQLEKKQLEAANAAKKSLGNAAAAVHPHPQAPASQQEYGRFFQSGSTGLTSPRSLGAGLLPKDPAAAGAVTALTGCCTIL